jgi:hypothetical protein
MQELEVLRRICERYPDKSSVHEFKEAFGDGKDLQDMWNKYIK